MCVTYQNIGYFVHHTGLPRLARKGHPITRTNLARQSLASTPYQPLTSTLPPEALRQHLTSSTPRSPPLEVAIPGTISRFCKTVTPSRTWLKVSAISWRVRSNKAPKRHAYDYAALIAPTPFAPKIEGERREKSPSPLAPWGEGLG